MYAARFLIQLKLLVEAYKCCVYKIKSCARLDKNQVIIYTVFVALSCLGCKLALKMRAWFLVLL